MNSFEETWWQAAADRDARRPGWHWMLRGVVVAWLGWALIQRMRGLHSTTVFSGIDLAIHEAGHLLFSPFGRFLMVAGGTILQLLAPIAAGIVFARQGDRFAVCFAAAWLGINLVEVSVYIADARAQALPLVTVGGGDALHDWHYLLGRLRCLGHDQKIAAVVRAAGYLLHAGAVIASGWLVVRMAGFRRPQST